MAVKTIKEDRPGGHVITEANYAISREQIVLAPTAVVLPSGTALGKITASGKYAPYNPAGADGTQNFAGFLYERRDISAGDQRAVAHVRQCEINGREVTYINTLTSPQQTAFETSAAAQGVLVRY
jgi:hypothetical protein